MKHARKTLLLAALLAALPASAQYAPSWYAGAGLGRGNLNINGTDLTGLTNAVIDDNDTTYTVRVGYRFHPNFAVEAGYYDLGQYPFRGGAPNGSEVTGSAKAKSFGISAVGILPMSDALDLYARIGIAHSELKVNANNFNLTANRNERQDEATYGVGGRWMFSRNVGVFVEWMKNDRIEVDSYVIGVDFRF